MREPRIPVAREGYPFIGFVALVTVVVAMLDYHIPALLGLGATGFVLYFFRDPERISPHEGDVLVAPADGKVILIDRVFDDRFVKEHVYKISIFMNVFNAHVNRVPFPGKVEEIVYSPGRFFAADSEQGGLENEYCAVTLATAADKRLAVVQVAGLLARRIVCWLEIGDLVERGQRFGLIRFGSRVDLYLPQHAHLEIEVGQRVRAGETILGYLT
jgi:phosphatidylserine decarboxylase